MSCDVSTVTLAGLNVTVTVFKVMPRSVTVRLTLPVPVRGQAALTRSFPLVGGTDAGCSIIFKFRTGVRY